MNFNILTQFSISYAIGFSSEATNDFFIFPKLFSRCIEQILYKLQQVYGTRHLKK